MTRFWRRLRRALHNPHLIRQWINRPRPEDYLPYSTTHQHKPTWRAPFVIMCGFNVVLLVIVMLLVGNQARFTEYTQDNREHLCELYDVVQQQTLRNYPGYQQLNCSELE